jgi:hypothetical protein
MAGEESAAAEPRPGESSQVQEKAQVVNETGHQQTERGAPQEINKNKPSPPLPPRPLPATHHETTLKQQQPLPPVPAQGVHFGPLPIEETHESDDFVRPFSPRWQKFSLVCGGLSLIASAVIFGVGIALGFLHAPYYYIGDSGPIDIELGASGSAVRLDPPPNP